MKNRTLKSYKNMQVQLAKRLTLILVVTISGFALFYFIFGQLEFLGKQGIYLEDAPANFLESLYFSVVTITTLGYGDFTPFGVSRFLSSLEALTGVIFAGYSISQILSVKQDASIEYILKSQIIQNYSGLLGDLKDAKASIKDAHALNKIAIKADISTLNLSYANPLYSPLIALQKINGYTKHIEEMKMVDEVEDYLNRAAVYIEELSSEVKKYINYVNETNKSWKTKETLGFLSEIIKSLEGFLYFIDFTKYKKNKYKGHADYKAVINKTISRLREISS